MDGLFRKRFEKIAGKKEPAFDAALMPEYQKAAEKDAAFAKIFNDAQDKITAQELDARFEHRDKPDEARKAIAVAYEEYLAHRGTDKAA